jgi:hypothetical protein
MSGRGIIALEPDQLCEMCGNIDECRPYGPNGEQICFDCATNKCDPAQVENRMMNHIFGDPLNGQSK